MPGYVMHLAEAELLLSQLEEHMGPLPGEWKTRFRLGSLLPDTRRRREKASSHFWNPGDSRKLAIAPDLSLFLSRYRDVLKGPVMAGYYAHLHLDERFVNHFWKEQFAFLDEAGREREERAEITTVRIRRSGLEIPEKDFFSPEYYYGDYSRMNDYFLKRYHLVCPPRRDLPDCPIREVDAGDLSVVLEELKNLFAGAYSMGSPDELKVFDLNQLEAFIAASAREIAPELCRLDPAVEELPE